eukprot:COSAG01_NODE_5413_length_4278_cov_33.242881_3_plen_199_part_00
MSATANTTAMNLTARFKVFRFSVHRYFSILWKAAADPSTTFELGRHYFKDVVLPVDIYPGKRPPHISGTNGRRTVNTQHQSGRHPVGSIPANVHRRCPVRSLELGRHHIFNFVKRIWTPRRCPVRSIELGRHNVRCKAFGCTDTAVLYGRCDPGSAVSTRGPKSTKAGQRAAAGCDAARTQPRRRCGVDFRTAAAAAN